MKVILLQDIYKQGVTGEVVEVADGYARNYLFPRNMAVRATKSAVRTHEHLSSQVEARRAAYENKLNEVARHINGAELFFERRAAATGKLFGSVTNQEIVDELEKVKGIDINRRRISQQGLRELGRHLVQVRLGSEMTPVLHVIILREGELQEYLAKREAEKAAAEQAASAATAATDMATEVIPGSAVRDALARTEAGAENS
ncbi:MAG: 50S ribosomal protein L9 [Anaerolineae bacterium]|nr:50S ribosomal protein L9 [Anaerolineae bacterium]